MVSLAAVFAAGCTSEPAPPAPAPSVFSRAENAVQRGEYARAIEAYRTFLKNPTDDTYVPRAWYKLALCQYRLQEYRAALATLDELANQFPGQTWAQSAALRGDVHQALGNHLSALEAWAEAWHVGDEKDRAVLRVRIENVVSSLGDAERERALDIIREPTIRTWIERSSSSARRMPSAPLPVSPLTTAGVTPARPTPPAVAKIGCLLPLSGPHRAFGARALQGIQLALGSERLIVKDTHGEPETARTAFNEFVGGSDVVAVIGPLRSNVASVVVPLVEPAQLPVLLLAQREGLTNHYVLQPVMTRSQQAAALVTHAMHARWRQLGILAPNDKYGREFSEAFRAAVDAHGGHLGWSESYDPRTHELTTPIAHAREQRSRGALDAVFVPDSASALVAIGTALRAAIPAVGLLGPNDWNDPSALAGAGSVLDGAVFVTGFFPDSARPATRAFVETFRAAYDATPDIFAAQAYDAAVLVREALQRGGATRATMLDALRRLGSVAGATGTLRVGPAGVERDLFLLRVVGGKLEEVDNTR